MLDVTRCTLVDNGDGRSGSPAASALGGIMARPWRTGFLLVPLAFLVQAAALLVAGYEAAGLLFGFAAVPFLLFAAARASSKPATRRD